MWQRVLYTIFWSLGLLFATFPNLFTLEMSFDLSNLIVSKASKDFYFPYLMVMELFLFDAIYHLVLAQSKGKVQSVVLELVLISMFFLMYALALFAKTSWLVVVVFFVGWFVLTLLKFFTTESCDSSPISSAKGIEVGE